LPVDRLPLDWSRKTIPTRFNFKHGLRKKTGQEVCFI